VQQLFETSLSRVQIHARNTARGIPEAADLPDRTELWNPKRLIICAIYKFKSTGWKNISVSGLWGAVSAAIVTMLLSTECGEGDLLIEKLLPKLMRSKAVTLLKRYGREGREACRSGLKQFKKIRIHSIKEAWNSIWQLIVTLHEAQMTSNHLLTIYFPVHRFSKISIPFFPLA
jgi:hypothetical protein